MTDSLTHHYLELISSPGFFDDFTEDSIIDWLYLDEFGLDVDEPVCEKCIIKVLEDLERYDLLIIIRDHLKFRE